MFVGPDTATYEIKDQNILMVALETLMAKVLWDLGLANKLCGGVSEGKWCSLSSMEHSGPDLLL